jgi:alkylated DNA nucleotide flippase Atl1
MDEATLEAVRAAVRAVPAGETSTYGEIAATAGIPRPGPPRRPDPRRGRATTCPGTRILRADGTCAPHITTEQLARLRAEGVILDRGRRR